MVRRDLTRAVVGSQGACTAKERELTTDPVGANGGTEFRCGTKDGIRDGEGVDLLPCALHMTARLGIRLGPLRGESFRVTIVGIAALDHLDALIEIGRRRHLDGESEAVEELRAEIPFFGIAASDEDEARGVPDADPLALDDVLTGRCDIEEEIDEVILEEVDLIDIEVAAIGTSEEAGFVGFLAAREGTLKIEGADYAIFGGPEREVDDGDRRLVRAEFVAGVHLGLTVGAETTG
jgi:hypothetical protein